MKMKYWIHKYYKLIATAFAAIVNSLGLILSIVGLFSDSLGGGTQRLIIILLTAAELFLVIAAIYSVVSIIKNTSDKVSVEQKDAEMIRYRDSNKVIYENHKAAITYYKDFRDRLSILANKHNEKLTEIMKYREEQKKDNNKDLEEYFNNAAKEAHKSLENELIDLYSRFIVNIINLLQESVEKYLQTKGCNASVSIALKQMEEPKRYSEIDDKAPPIYTAFRDGKTYLSKIRNETWEKSFCIRKNSDFVFSIERDYYIFNYMTKVFSENGLYLNENMNFYEYYNSGVTCSVHCCENKERWLYGFLACDSLFDKEIERKCGRNIYDYNVANIMMSSAHLIALFLEDFLKKWEKYQNEYEKLQNALVPGSQYIKKNFCNVMLERMRKSRYRR